MTVIGCLQSIDPNEPNSRCALPVGHLGPCGGALSDALQPHAFVFSTERPCRDIEQCELCHCRPGHAIHQAFELPGFEQAPLAQPPAPEATEPPLRDEQEVAFDPIARYLRLLNPEREAPMLSAGDPVLMAIAVGILEGVKELRRIGDALENLGTRVWNELDIQAKERQR